MKKQREAPFPETKEPLSPEAKNGKKYECVFDLTDDCPIRRHFKLEPESLVEFCKICPILQEEMLDIEESYEKDKPCSCQEK